jgi:hypothetical protein
MHSNRISIVIGLIMLVMGAFLLNVYASKQGKLSFSFFLSLYRYVNIASHWRKSGSAEINAKEWYKWDFEQGKGNWSLGPGTALSSKYSHSGTRSVVSNATGENGRYAEIFIDMIPRDARTLVESIWVYHDGRNTSPMGGGTHHISSWALAPGVRDWSGPHIVTSEGNEIGFFPFDRENSWSGMRMKQNVWYRVKVVIDIDNSNFDVYVLEDGKSESDEVRVIEKGIFVGSERLPMLPYRRFGAWLSPGVDAYFDDYSIGGVVKK